jgi:hypothetical protein
MCGSAFIGRSFGLIASGRQVPISCAVPIRPRRVVSQFLTRGAGSICTNRLAESSRMSVQRASCRCSALVTADARFAVQLRARDLRDRPKSSTCFGAMRTWFPERKDRGMAVRGTDQRLQIQHPIRACPSQLIWAVMRVMARQSPPPASDHAFDLRDRGRSPIAGAAGDAMVERQIIDECLAMAPHRQAFSALHGVRLD